jgi:thioredoxin 1
MNRFLFISAVIFLSTVMSFAQTPAATSTSVTKGATAVNAKPRAKKKIVKADSTKPKEAMLPKLVDLGADKCVPCKMMAPILEELKKDYAGKLDVVFIDVWKNSAEGEKYGIKLIPTQIFYGPEGKELFRHEGFFAKEDILAKWKELGHELKK